MYEPIMLCASCAQKYRDAGCDVKAVKSIRIKGECEFCRGWNGMAYVIERNGKEPTTSGCCPCCGREYETKQ